MNFRNQKNQFVDPFSSFGKGGLIFFLFVESVCFLYNNYVCHANTTQIDNIEAEFRPNFGFGLITTPIAPFKKALRLTQGTVH